MNKRNIEKGIEMGDELEEKRKNIPKEVSQQIIKKMFIHILKAVGAIVYAICINYIYMNVDQNKSTLFIKIFSTIFLIVGLIELERAYKKDSGRIVLSGIELLVLSFYTLSILHITTLLKYNYTFYVLTFSYIFAIYYVLKDIFIYTKEKKEYLESLSDISEIVKNDEPIKKEAKKKEKNIEVEEVKK